jgi:hypothetical protein
MAIFYGTTHSHVNGGLSWSMGSKARERKEVVGSDFPALAVFSLQKLVGLRLAGFPGHSIPEQFHRTAILELLVHLAFRAGLEAALPAFLPGMQLSVP